MTMQQLDDAVLGELFEVLGSAESLIARSALGSNGDQIIDDIMQLRSRLIAKCPGAGIYSAALLRAVLDNAVDAIIIIDDRGIVSTFNPAAERMFGYAAEEMVGTSVNALMPSPYREEHDDYIARYLRTSEARVVGIGREVMGRRKDGSTFPVHLAMSEVRGGGRTMFAGFLRRISSPEPSEDER